MPDIDDCPGCGFCPCRCAANLALLGRTPGGVESGDPHVARLERKLREGLRQVARLETERDRLREVLRTLLGNVPWPYHGGPPTESGDAFLTACTEARTLLGGVLNDDQE
jgi:hypothetical protein